MQIAAFHLRKCVTDAALARAREIHVTGVGCFLKAEKSPDTLSHRDLKAKELK